MNETLTTFLHLKDCDAEKLNGTFYKQQDNVIASFGGLSNMIELCLTNPNLEQYIDKNSLEFNSFKQMLYMQDKQDSIITAPMTSSLPGKNDIKIVYYDTDESNICNNSQTMPSVGKSDHDTDDDKNINDDDDENDNDDDDQGSNAHAKNMNAMNINSNTKTESTNVCNGNISNNNNKTCTLVSNNLNLNQRQMLRVKTAIEFYNSRLIIDCDTRNNLLHSLIKNEKIALRLYNIILSARLLIGVVLSGGIVMVVQLLRYFVPFLLPIFTYAGLIESIIITLYFVALISIANKNIITLITNTFDFWFKVYNLIIFLLASWIRSYGIRHEEENSIFRGEIAFAGRVVWHICYTTILIVTFVLDAVPASAKFKRTGAIILIVVSSIDAIRIYFVGLDYELNPFDKYQFIYSKISFKAIMISSLINLILFMAKPIVSDLINCLRKNDHDATSKTSVVTMLTHQAEYQRCSTLYKRPYLKWYKIEAAQVTGNYNIDDRGQKRHNSIAVQPTTIRSFSNPF